MSDAVRMSSPFSADLGSSPSSQTSADRDAALASLFERGIVGIAEVDSRTRRFVRVNRRYCEILRRSETELLTLGPRDILLAEDREDLESQFKAAARGAGLWQGKVRHVLGDGTVAWVQLGISISQRAADGAPLRSVSVIQDISESVVASERLRLNEEILRLGQQVGRIATFVRDLRNDTAACNAESRDIVGLPPGEGDINPEDWRSVIVPEDLKRVVELSTRAIADRATELAWEVRTRRQGESEIRHFEMRTRFFYDDEGQPLRSISVAIDVTERVRAAEKLRLGEEKLRLGQQVGRIATFVRNLTTGVVAANAESRAMLGLPQDEGEFPVEVWSSVIFADDRPRVAAIMASAVAKRESEVAYRFRVQRPGETEVRHFEMRARYIYDESGRPLHSVGVAIDVTENVRAAEKLRLSEEMRRLGQEVGKMATFAYDLVSGAMTVTPESRALIGLPSGDAEVTFRDWLLLMVPEDRRRLTTAISGALARREENLGVKYRLLRPRDGETRFIEMRARYFYDAQGRPLRSVGVSIDVTEIERAAERLRVSEEMLRLGQQVGQIAAFTHDFVSQTVTINSESRILLGLPSGDEPLTSQEWIHAIVPEDRERVVADLERMKGSREEMLVSEHRLQRGSDGAIRWLYVRARCFYDENGQPQRAIGVCIDITERRLAEQQLAHAARHDALTGLPNRTVLREKLEEALARSRRGEPFAVLCLDLDRFKEVNDTLGHAVGDRLLVEATARISASLRGADTLARLGGDEFAIVLGQISGPAAASVAQRIVAKVSEPYLFDDQKALVGVSIGIALGPADGADGEALMKAADMALYQAKGDGRGRYAFFAPEMNARMQSRRALQMDLAAALERREFELHYQPILDVASRRIAGFEALVRWRRGDGRLTPPDQFIPLCEETGLIGPLGAFVLQAAAREAATWGAGLTVAVNLSPLQFSTGRVEPDIAAALQASGLPPSRLEIEITESAVLHDTEATLATLMRLKRRSIRIAMDDFGAGYSSLSYLQRFPFDRVKIDRGFTQQVARSRKSHAIVKAMTELCDALQMSTTAEGVETEEQLRAVARIGCQDAQGYLFSRPVPAGEIPGLLAKFGAVGPTALAAE